MEYKDAVRSEPIELIIRGKEAVVRIPEGFGIFSVDRVHRSKEDSRPALRTNVYFILGEDILCQANGISLFHIKQVWLKRKPTHFQKSDQLYFGLEIARIFNGHNLVTAAEKMERKVPDLLFGVLHSLVSDSEGVIKVFGRIYVWFHIGNLRRSISSLRELSLGQRLWFLEKDLWCHEKSESWSTAIGVWTSKNSAYLTDREIVSLHNCPDPSRLAKALQLADNTMKIDILKGKELFTKAFDIVDLKVECNSNQKKRACSANSSDIGSPKGEISVAIKDPIRSSVEMKNLVTSHVIFGAASAHVSEFTSNSSSICLPADKVTKFCEGSNTENIQSQSSLVTSFQESYASKQINNSEDTELFKNAHDTAELNVTQNGEMDDNHSRNALCKSTSPALNSDIFCGISQYVFDEYNADSSVESCYSPPSENDKSSTSKSQSESSTSTHVSSENSSLSFDIDENNLDGHSKVKRLSSLRCDPLITSSCTSSDEEPQIIRETGFSTNTIMEISSTEGVLINGKSIIWIHSSHVIGKPNPNHKIVNYAAQLLWETSSIYCEYRLFQAEAIWFSGDEQPPSSSNVTVRNTTQSRISEEIEDALCTKGFFGVTQEDTDERFQRICHTLLDMSRPWKVTNYYHECGLEHLPNRVESLETKSVAKNWDWSREVMNGYSFEVVRDTLATIHMIESPKRKYVTKNENSGRQVINGTSRHIVREISPTEGVLIVDNIVIWVHLSHIFGTRDESNSMVYYTAERLWMPTRIRYQYCLYQARAIWFSENTRPTVLSTTTVRNSAQSDISRNIMHALNSRESLRHSLRESDEQFRRICESMLGVTNYWNFLNQMSRTIHANEQNIENDAQYDDLETGSDISNRFVPYASLRPRILDGSSSRIITEISLTEGCLVTGDRIIWIHASHFSGRPNSSNFVLNYTAELLWEPRSIDYKYCLYQARAVWFSGNPRPKNFSDVSLEDCDRSNIAKSIKMALNCAIDSSVPLSQTDSRFREICESMLSLKQPWFFMEDFLNARQNNKTDLNCNLATYPAENTTEGSSSEEKDIMYKSQETLSEISGDDFFGNDLFSDCDSSSSDSCDEVHYEETKIVATILSKMIARRLNSKWAKCDNS